MLRHSGISFTEDQKKLIFSLSDTNKKSEAMSEILKVIEGQLSGVAKSAAGDGSGVTVAGAFDELGRKFTLFQEELLGGTTLLKMFTQAVLKLADAIPAVDLLGMTDADLIAKQKELMQQLEIIKSQQKLAEGMEYKPSLTELFTGIPNMDHPALRDYKKEIEEVQKILNKVNEEIKLRKELEQNTSNTEGEDDGDFTKGKIYKDAEKKVESFIMSQKLLKEQLGKTGAELEMYKLRQQMLNKIKLDGTDLTKEEIKILDQLIEGAREHAEALEQMQKIYGAFEGAVNKAFSTVENSIIGLIRGTESLKDVMKKMMQAFIADLTTSIIKMLILDRLKKTILASAGGPIGSIVGAIFGRQGGGAVSNNTPYLVGEKGPELFIPNSSGRVAPMDKAGFGAQTRQQTPIVVEQHINFTTGVQATVRSEVLNLLPQIQNSTIAAVQEARLRGGKFAESFGAR